MRTSTHTAVRGSPRRAASSNNSHAYVAPQHVRSERRWASLSEGAKHAGGAHKEPVARSEIRHASDRAKRGIDASCHLPRLEEFLTRQACGHRHLCDIDYVMSNVWKASLTYKENPDSSYKCSRPRKPVQRPQARHPCLLRLPHQDPLQAIGTLASQPARGNPLRKAIIWGTC